MTSKEFNNFKKLVRKSAKKCLPKFVSIDEFSLDTMSIYLSIPLDDRTSDCYEDTIKRIHNWAKTFGYEEYGSGTGGWRYDIHLGPSTKLLNDQVKRIKNAIKNSLAEMDILQINDFCEIVGHMQMIGLVPDDVDVGIRLDIEKIS